MRNRLIFIGYGVVCFIIILFLIEKVSGFLLKKIDPKNYGTTLKLNRELSGYTLFKSTPNYTHWTYKVDEREQDIKTDSFGFICNEILQQQKDSNTIRIFLMGGSAMLGAGQNTGGNCYNLVKEFPLSIYAYNISIAGYLKAYLSAQFPDKHIQVINNACYERQLHQSMLSYLETVNRFEPDIIINMDGYNDMGGIMQGDIYAAAERSYLQKFATLKSANQSWLFRLKSVQLAQYIMLRLKDSAPAKTSTTIKSTAYLGASAYNAPIASNCTCWVDSSKYNAQTYSGIYRNQFIQNSATWLKIVDDYMAILKHNNVKFMFVLQPILARTVNKPLAEYEQKMATINVNGNQDSTYNGRQSLLLKYFYDDYLSGALKKEVEASNFVYCDMNKEILALDSNFHFYVDYCHMTKEGNKFVAEKIGSLILENGLIK